MLTIAHHAMIDHFKKNKRYTHKDTFDWKPEDGLNVDEQIIKEEKLRQLKTAMNKLSPDKQEILVLSKYKGLPYKEIGEILGYTENNVKIRVFRALSELKQIYTEIEID